MYRYRQGTFLIAVICVTLFTATQAIACFHCIFRPQLRYRRKSMARACKANMKTIAGALEMYNMDNNTDIQEIRRDLMEEFVAEGYLQSMPKHPTPDSQEPWECYTFTTTGEIFCYEHGFVQHSHDKFTDSLPPYEQLLLDNETNPDILQRASRKSPFQMTVSDKIIRKNSQYGEALFILTFSAFIFWIPLSAYWLRFIRKRGSILPIVCVVTNFVAITATRNAFFCPFVAGVSWIILSIDIFCWSVGFLLSKKLMLEVIGGLKTRLSNLTSSEAEKFRSYLETNQTRYRKLAQAMVSILVIVAILFICSSHNMKFVHRDVFFLFLFSLPLSIAGAITGAVRFGELLTSCDNRTCERRVTGILRVLFVVSVTGLAFTFHCQGVFSVKTYQISNGVLNMTGLAMFFITRALAVQILSRRFLSIFDNLRKAAGLRIVSKPTLALKDILSLQGVSTLPSKSCLEPGPGCGPRSPRPDDAGPWTNHPLLWELSVDGAVCPVCGEGFESGQAVFCRDCSTPHHSDCWEFSGQCSMYGCECSEADLPSQTLCSNTKHSAATELCGAQDMTLRKSLSRTGFLMTCTPANRSSSLASRVLAVRKRN